MRDQREEGPPPQDYSNGRHDIWSVRIKDVDHLPSSRHMHSSLQSPIRRPICDSTQSCQGTKQNATGINDEAIGENASIKYFLLQA